MRVAIDLTPLNERPSGVDRYIFGMVRSLLELDLPQQYLLFINVEDRPTITRLVSAAPASARVRVHAVANRRRPSRLFFQQVLLPVLMAALRIDVLHSPAFIIPMCLGRAGHLLTIHDMTSFLLPRCHPSWRRGRLYETAVRTSIMRADLVSVPSPSVREDILRLVPQSQPGRVRVISCGIDAAFVPRGAAEIAPSLAELGIDFPYILYVGTLDARKNLARLVDTYARLVECGSVAEHLVIAGQPSWHAPDFAGRLRLPPLRDRVHVLGFVAERHLPCLYAGARVFVYPSLLEGFGFPPLEAMACGTPVVASDSSSLRDNLAGAAVLVPAEDADGLSTSILRLLGDELWRAEKIASGLARAAAFRWDAFARATSQCYSEIASERGRNA